MRALSHALDGDRLHPALLLTGTRGVGKTTLGRIVAKCLNCEKGVGSEPCAECSACREVDEGRFIDLIEIDAASRTKVEDTRQLLDNVAYAPARGRYKVYLIDEVHMLSTSSFNALLKTLEEPPPHVKFILATTDPQKLPVTVLSRCLKFNLRRLPVALIREVLTEVIGDEKLEAEPAALTTLAQAADGSMRDGLSLLDQAIVYANGARLERSAMETMLGTVGRRGLLELLTAVDGGDGKALLAGLDDLASVAPDYAALLDMLATDLQRIATLQLLPEAGSEEDDSRLDALAQTIAAEDVQIYYEIAVHARRDLRWAPAPRVGFEMALLRMYGFRPEPRGPGNRGAGSDTRAVAAVAAHQAVPTAAPPAPTAVAGDSDDTAAVSHGVTTMADAGIGVGADVETGTHAASVNAVAAVFDGAWPADINCLQLVAFSRELARHCALAGEEDGAVRLTLDPVHGHLLTEARRVEIEQALALASGHQRRLLIALGQGEILETPARAEARGVEQRQAEAEVAARNGAAAQALQAAFGATLKPGSVRPAD